MDGAAAERGEKALSDQLCDTIFCEDVYLYDLNRLQSEPLAYRCARGGEQQIDLLSLLGVSAYEWMRYEDRLYSMPICLVQAGAVVLPVFGSIGRLAVVVKPMISNESFSCLAQSMCLGEVCDQESAVCTGCAISAREREDAEYFLQTLAKLRLLIGSCYEAKNEFEIEDCISLACTLWGVERMPIESAEFDALRGQLPLADMQISGQALMVFLMTHLSLMRNQAHARSGWLFAERCEGGVALQVMFRTFPNASLQALSHLRALLEDGGVVLGERTYASHIKPPRQYAYMNKKIIDPRHPYCTRCGCLDKHCADCIAVQWAVLPYVCDAALLGIKNYLSWNE